MCGAEWMWKSAKRKILLKLILKKTLMDINLAFINLLPSFYIKELEK